MPKASAELLKLRSVVTAKLAEDSHGFMVPEKLGTLSDNDKARLVYALGFTNQKLIKENLELVRHNHAFARILRDLTDPVSDQ